MHCDMIYSLRILGYSLEIGRTYIEDGRYHIVLDRKALHTDYSSLDLMGHDVLGPDLADAFPIDLLIEGAAVKKPVVRANVLTLQEE
ncbi:hypothetical protein KAH43_06765 [Candidatus Bipolaricaulota bacterium]|nr:hypothetical protein [Candidatus Bipolaricaulota bacterium]